jgi:Fe2+ or Zn2+ uptake regulation protein
MRIYSDERKQDKIQTIICNKCQKNIKVENDIVREGLFQANFRFGYFSQKDSEIHSFDLCEACYDQITREFLIPPEITEACEIM